MKKLILLLLVLLIQAGSLFFMGAELECIAAFSPRYYLETNPVDPRDIFRGDYVTLGYDFSPYNAKFETDSFRASPKFKKTNKCYVLFDETDSKVLIPKCYSWDKTDSVFMVATQNRQTWSPELRTSIGKYFIEQGKGLDLEKLRNAKRLFIEVAIGSSGKAVITGHRVIEKQ